MVYSEQILRKLSAYPESSVVGNPYLEQYAVDNLRHYFEYMLKVSGKRVLLVGEAPGHKGCRITGIPFTSGKVFRDISHPMLLSLKEKIKLPEIAGESTATIVWNYLAGKENTPLFWNSFPFHPHEENNISSNRPPTTLEVEFGSKILVDVIQMFKPEQIAGVGHSGISALKRALPNQEFTYIRHPSNGGKPKFIEGMNGVI